ncbi:flagellar assembly protein FlgT [Thalassolituus hydrocarboniclasticus]|uniref:Flagella assembly protein FlgT n=1 Tax=Thalassolituus hydrocarboniclasticus TaxID=2742796 RepID=A0ABY6AE68_9GAMM|nr:flagellar assembly protein FlgT [Thalassolituus hydrocarboniclasticus]UXD88586.1 flagella assembly protein FlgT [Thalassolituus hydrocarboniclasticus]
MRILNILMMTLCSLPVSALTVEVTGEAPLSGAISYAREQALQDAMRQASLRAGAQVSSTQLMSQGVVKQDDVQVRSNAQLKNIEVLWEDQAGGLYQVAIRADVSPQAMCPASTQRYRKAVAVAGFGLARPQQATLGQLQNIEQDLPRVLVNTLNNRGAIHALDATRTSLYQDPRRAPSMETAQQRLTTSVALATQLGAQYVVSGVVRDLSMMGEAGNDSRRASGADSWLDLLGLEDNNRDRQFVMDVFVHDGLSGAMLFQRSYSAHGAWDRPARERVPFASPHFWQTPYGAEVRELLSGVVDDVDEVLRCQPFMARIVKAKGNRLHIEASAGAGIRPGDKFQVYRTGTFYNLDLEPRTELSDMATEVVIKQVQPQFVVAEMKLTAEHLAIQRDDMVIAW